MADAQDSTTNPPKRRRWLRRTLIGVGLTIIVVPLIAFALLQTGWGQRQAIGFANGALADSGLTLETGAINGLVPFDMTIPELRVIDVQGTAIAADNLHLSIVAGDLLGGLVTVSDFAATQLVINRVPETPATPPAPSSEPAWPALPVDLAIDRLDLDRLELGAELAGEDLALTVAGSFALSSSAGTATLSIDRLDGPPARVTMTATADPNAETLSLDLVAEEPEGGVVPRLAGWNYDGSWRLELKGDGPLDRWQGRLLATAGSQTLADIAIGGALDPDTPRLTIAGVLSAPDGLVPPELAPGQITVDLAASLADDAATVAGTINGRGLDLDLDATVSLDSPIAIDATLNAAAQEMTATLAGLGLPVAGAVQIQARAQGPLNALDGQLSVTTQQLDAFGWTAERLALQATFNGAPLDQTGSATLSLAVQSPLSADLDMPGYGITAVSLQATVATGGDGDIIGLSDLALDAGPHQAQGSASFNPKNGTVGFDLALSSQASIALASAGFTDAQGRLLADVAGAFNPGAGIGWVEMTAQAEGLGLGNPLMDELLGAAPVMEFSGQVDTVYGLQGVIASIRLPAMIINIDGDLAFDPANDDAPLAFNVDIDSLTRLAGPLGMAPDDLAGALSLSGSIGGVLSDTPRSVIDLTGDSIQIAGQTLDTLSTTLAIQPGEDGQLLAIVDSELDGSYGPVVSAIEASIDLDGSKIVVDAIDVTALGTRLTGGVQFDLATLAMDGTLNATAGNLGSLSALTGTALTGSANARIALSHADGRQAATVALTGQSIGMPDTVSTGQVTANVTVGDLMGDLSLRGTAAISNLSAEGVSLEETTLDFGGTPAGLNLQVATSGETTSLGTGQPVSLNADVQLGLADVQTSIEFNNLSASVGDETLDLSQPMRLRLAGSSIVMTGLDASLLGGRISGDARLTPGDVDVSIQAAGLALGRAAALTGGVGVEANLEQLSIELSGTGASPSGQISLTLGGVQIEGDAVVSALADAKLVVNATIRNAMTEIDMSLGNVTANPITFRLANAMRLSLAPIAAEFNHGLPLDGQLLAQTNLRDVAPLIAPSGEILLSGDANVDIRIGGVGGAPVFSGDGTVSNGTAEVAATGLYMTDLNAEIAGDGDRLTITRLTASDLEGGTLSASGWADFGANQSALEVNLTLNRFLAFNTDYADAAATGIVTAAGPLLGPSISGDITIRPAEIRFAEIKTASYVEVDAIDINGSSQLEPEPIDITPPIALPLDLRISIPNALFVRGYGLESEWGGNLQISGTTALPSITGSISVLRGTLDLAGQPIEIGRGIVTFTGASPPDPLIDLVAVSDQEDLQVIVTVSGPASSADFELDSVPSLPREEILSRLLFGIGSGGLSGNQAFQAGRALALLTGGEGDLGVVNTLRSITGITGLTIETDTDAEGNPVGQVGGYVSEDVYLSVSRGSATGSGEAEISVEVFDGIDVQSSVTETGDSRFGVNFEWDY